MRRNDWLTAQTVHRMQELLSAITDLSVDSKLKLAGVKTGRNRSSVENSRQLLLDFFDRLDGMIKRSRTTPTGLMLGADPETGAIARKFLAADRGSTQDPDRWVDLAHLRALLTAKTNEELRELSDVLETLRTLVEEQSHAGITAVLGEI
jgi:hypothetical protein